MMQHGYNPLMQYRNQQKMAIETADRVKLVTMLLEGCIRYNKKAQMAVESGNTVAALENSDAGYKIVIHLYSCLDLSRSDKVVENLASLYNFCSDQYFGFMRRSSENYLKSDVLERINNIIGNILDAWKQLPSQE